MPAPSWNALLAASAADLDARLARIADTAALMIGQRPPFHPGDVVAAAGRTLSEAATVRGPAVLAAPWQGLLPLLPAACAGVDPAAPGRVPTVVGLLELRVTVANALGASTLAAWPAACAAWPRMLAGREPAAEPRFRLAAAWSALGLGDRDAARALVPPRPITGSTHPPRDPTTLLIHVQAAPDAAAAWWPGFLADVPLMMATGAIDWRLLQAVGRVLLGTPDGDGAGVRIHQAVLAAAAIPA
jgi:hypothetical protein